MREDIEDEEAREELGKKADRVSFSRAVPWGTESLVTTTAAIITTCDRPQMLARAVESVRRQSMPVDELIVVNDGMSEVVVDGATLLRTGPLFHDRQMCPKAPLVAARDALADALGVGLSRAMLLGVPTDEQAVRSIAQARLDALGRCLAEAERSAQACAARGCPVGTLVEWLGAARRALVLPTAKLVFDERAS